MSPIVAPAVSTTASKSLTPTAIAFSVAFTLNHGVCCARRGYGSSLKRGPETVSEAFESEIMQESEA